MTEGDRRVLTFSEAAPTDSVAVTLIDELSSELAERYQDVWPGDGRSNYRPDDFDPVSDAFVVGYVDGVPVCCGALRRFDGTTVEVKRMFVRADARSGGIGARLLQHLERTAVARGYTEIVLETGSEQPEALRLYRNAGYDTTAPWPPYDQRPYAHCFRKVLRL